jgi:hypothetical protein
MLGMLQKGAEELEKKIANFNTILQQLKTAAITIWVALIGWALTSKIDVLVPLGYVMKALIADRYPKVLFTSSVL